ncbi:MAG TPA: hypothetical protein VFU69_11655 [Ktedonobacterales bacterium]|nr:hypothetical protein [Ktedonobacterales bacterium]
MPGSIVFRWYDRKQADEIYSAWTVKQLLARLEADKANADTQPLLGKPGVATTDSLERLLSDMRARGYGETPMRQLPTERASDALLHYELICDACTQAEWRAKEAFIIRHVSGLRADAGQEFNRAYLAPEELEEQYKASREGRFRWREWSALTEALERLEWSRWEKTFRASYEADKATRRDGVERALCDNYAAAEELRQHLQEGERHSWALVVYNANDERLPFPPPPILMDAVRRTEEEVAQARQAAEATLARRRRFQRIIVPIVLIAVFLLLSFLFTQTLLGGLIGTVLIILIIAAVVYLIIRPQART